jgi:hypothetical protein
LLVQFYGTLLILTGGGVHGGVIVGGGVHGGVIGGGGVHGGVIGGGIVPTGGSSQVMQSSSHSLRMGLLGC